MKQSILKKEKLVHVFTSNPSLMKAPMVSTFVQSIPFLIAHTLLCKVFLDIYPRHSSYKCKQVQTLPLHHPYIL